MGKEQVSPAAEEIKHPDARLHLYISLIKSVVRMAAGVALIATLGEDHPFIVAAGVLLVVAEVLGIAEELV
jgi:hypothetical protein